MMTETEVNIKTRAVRNVYQEREIQNPMVASVGEPSLMTEMTVREFIPMDMNFRYMNAPKDEIFAPLDYIQSVAAETFSKEVMKTMYHKVVQNEYGVKEHQFRLKYLTDKDRHEMQEKVNKAQIDAREARSSYTVMAAHASELEHKVKYYENEGFWSFIKRKLSHKTV